MEDLQLQVLANHSKGDGLYTIILSVLDVLQLQAQSEHLEPSTNSRKHSDHTRIMTVIQTNLAGRFCFILSYCLWNSQNDTTSSSS